MEGLLAEGGVGVAVLNLRMRSAINDFVVGEVSSRMESSSAPLESTTGCSGGDDSFGGESSGIGVLIARSKSESL